MPIFKYTAHSFIILTCTGVTMFPVAVAVSSLLEHGLDAVAEFLILLKVRNLQFGSIVTRERLARAAPQLHPGLLWLG